VGGNVPIVVGGAIVRRTLIAIAQAHKHKLFIAVHFMSATPFAFILACIRLYAALIRSAGQAPPQIVALGT